MAFVCWDVSSSCVGDGEVVDGVDGGLQTGQFARDPGDILSGETAHDEDAGVVGARRFESAGFESGNVVEGLMAGRSRG